MQTMERVILKGEVTSPIDLPDECRFAGRCPDACNNCKAHGPQLHEISSGYFVACAKPLL